MQTPTVTDDPTSALTVIGPGTKEQTLTAMSAATARGRHVHIAGASGEHCVYDDPECAETASAADPAERSSDSNVTDCRTPI